MNMIACNYAIARFLPYPETGEFVNVGVLLTCPQTGFFNYQLEMRRRARIHDFFPELLRDVYTTGLRSFGDQLRYFHAQVSAPSAAEERPFLPLDKNQARLAFATLTRPREALFRFSSPSTILTEDPTAKLKDLFEYYVRRQFALEKGFQEEVMTPRLEKMLAEHRLTHLYATNVRLGTDEYHVTMPFVHRDPYTHAPARAIKPLDLNKRSPTEILEHGDHWIARINRLRTMGAAPSHMLFTVHLPPEEQGQRVEAAKRVLDGFHSANTNVLRYEDDVDILEFARAVPR